MRRGEGMLTKVSRHDGILFAMRMLGTQRVEYYQGRNTREEKEAAADVATLLEALIVSERQSRRVTRACSGCVPSSFSMGELWNYRCGNTSRYEEFLVSMEGGKEGRDRDRWWFCFGYEISGILWGCKSDGSVSVNYYCVGDKETWDYSSWLFSRRIIHNFEGGMMYWQKIIISDLVIVRKW